MRPPLLQPLPIRLDVAAMTLRGVLQPGRLHRLGIGLGLCGPGPGFGLGGDMQLRQEIVDGHQEIIRLLREQMDEDLSLLVDLGAWMRSLEIVSKLVVETPEVDKRPLCIGSPALLADLRQDFAKLSRDTRRSTQMLPVILVLRELERVWGDERLGSPPQSMVARTHEQLRTLMEEITLK